MKKFLILLVALMAIPFAYVENNANATRVSDITMQNSNWENLGTISVVCILNRNQYNQVYDAPYTLYAKAIGNRLVYKVKDNSGREYSLVYNSNYNPKGTELINKYSHTFRGNYFCNVPY